MNESEVKWCLQKAIASEPLEACELIRQVIERLEAEQWGDEALFAVHMALEEAVMNAIKHGNRRDVSKMVHLAVDCNCNKLEVTVRDEGQGFVPGDIPDPTEDENLERSSGRGVLLMKEFMDEVVYNETGNEVRMIKRKNA